MSKQKQTQFTLTKTTVNYLSALDITPTAKLVLIFLTTCYNPQKNEMFPKQQTIAAKIGISENRVVSGIKQLVQANLLTKRRIPYGTNQYTFTEHFFSEVHFIDYEKPRHANIDYDLWREAIFKKFNNTCQLCGKTGGSMHAHHKKEYANNPEKRYDISNGILLCAECHKKLHPWMK